MYTLTHTRTHIHCGSDMYSSNAVIVKFSISNPIIRFMVGVVVCVTFLYPCFINKLIT